MSLEGSSSCGSPFSVSSTSAKITCVPYDIGSKRFYVADQSGGDPISGSTSLYVNVSAPTPSISSVSPTSAIKGVSTTFTVYGSNLPSSIAMSLEGSSSCGSPFSVSSTSAKITCVPYDIGSKRFYVADQSGGDPISGSTSLYVNVSAPTPSISSVSPTSAIKGVSTTFTVYGSNLPSSIAMSLEGSSSCGSPFSVSSTSAKITCVPYDTGSKRFYVADQSGGDPISGSTSLYVNVSAADQVPSISINSGPTVSGNELTANVYTSDDNDIVRTSFTIFESGQSNSLAIGTSVSVNSPTSTYNSAANSWGYNPSTATTTTAWSINISGLPDGEYDIEFYAADGVNSEIPSTGKHNFTKISADVPAVTLMPVRESSDPNKDFTFEVQLSGALPAGYGVFLNFDDLQGSWFANTDDGGHIAVPVQSGTTYSLDTSLNKLAIRFFRAGIFYMNGDSNPDNDTMVGSWSNTQTCTLDACLSTVSRSKSYATPAPIGSELFKNVDVARGSYHLAKTDMSVPGIGPSFAFSRAYNSLHASPWTFAYEMKLATVDGNDRQVSIGPREDGRMQYFFKDMVDAWHALNPGDFDQLIEESDGSFTLYTQGNRLYRFADPGTALTGRLQTIEDRLGNALSLGYDTNNNLTKVTDAKGRIYTITRDSSNRISRVTDFTGRYVAYTYNANGMITKVRKMRGDAYYDSYTYHAVSPTYLVSITDARSYPTAQVTIDYTLDNENKPYRVNSITDIAGNATSFLYGVSDKWGGAYTGVAQPKVDSLNHNRVYVFDSKKQIVKMYDAKSAAEALTSDDIVTTKSYMSAADNSRFADLALVSTIKDPNANETTITYDDQVAHGRPETIVDAASRTTEATYSTVIGQENLTPVATISKPGISSPLRYSSFTATGQAKVLTNEEDYTTNQSFSTSTGRLTQTTNPRGNSTNFTYDTNGNLTRTTDALGNQTNRTYDTLGRLATETSPLGLVTTYTYDAHDNILSRRESDGNAIYYITQHGYDASDNLSYTIDPKGHRRDYTYDGMNRKIREEYTVGGELYVTTYTYDALGRLATVTNARSQTTETHYTSRSQVKYKVNPLHETMVTYSYDKNGNVETVTDGEGRVVTTTYDVLNRKIKVTDELGNYQQWTYNTAGQIASYRDARGKTTAYTYDDVGNLTKVTDPAGGITRSTYDGNGNQLTVTDPKSHTTTYTYDALDRRISTRLQNGQQWTYSYDANGNLLTETTPTGERTVKVYDALNRVTQRTEYAADNSIVRQVIFTYDANNNVLSKTGNGTTITYSYDEINRIASITDQYGKTLGYGYDKAGNRTTLTYPGNKIVRYSYDAADRLQSLTDWLNNTTSYSRNDAGQPTEVVYGNGAKVQYAYDASGRLTLLKNVGADEAVISRHNLTLDGRGNVIQADADLPLAPKLPKAVATLTYDNNNRILTAGSDSYNHDSSGRIIKENQSGAQTIYTFDINDHLTSITSGSETLSSYGYDLNNNRVSQVQAGTETRYVIDQLADLPNVVAETSSAGVVSSYYLYGEGLVAQINDAGKVHYYHFDPTGHTLALTDGAGVVTDRYAYAPYGFTTVQGSTHNPFQFVGRYGVMDDGNGLHYMRARYYKEDIKRFMGLDALLGDMVTPQSLNRYAYVQGNPVVWIDPSGESWRAVGYFSLAAVGVAGLIISAPYVAAGSAVVAAVAAVGVSTSTLTTAGSMAALVADLTAEISVENPDDFNISNDIDSSLRFTNYYYSIPYVCTSGNESAAETGEYIGNIISLADSVYSLSTMGNGTWEILTTSVVSSTNITTAMSGIFDYLDNNVSKDKIIPGRCLSSDGSQLWGCQ